MHPLAERRIHVRGEHRRLRGLERLLHQLLEPRPPVLQRPPQSSGSSRDIDEPSFATMARATLPPLRKRSSRISEKHMLTNPLLM